MKISQVEQTGRIKKVRVTFIVNVLIDRYIEEYELDSISEAVSTVKSDAEQAARANLSILGFLVSEEV